MLHRRRSIPRSPSLHEMMFAVIAFAAVAHSTPDNADLVQGRLHAGTVPVPVTVPTPAPTPAPNTTAPTPAPTPTPYQPLYRLTFKSTYGDDHVCLTEVEFYDTMNNTISAEFVEATSCWGCAVSCGNCTVEYGNPKVIFDGVSNVDSPQAYYCTDFSSFDAAGDGGVQTVTFKLGAVPDHFALMRPDIKGTAIAKRFILEVLQIDDTWTVIRDAHVEASTYQKVKIEFMSGPTGKWWQYENPNCMTDMKLPPTANGSLNVDYLTVPATVGKLQNNGRGVFLDGKLGALRFNNETYYAKHFHFVFPSGRKLGKEGEKFVLAGELHIAHQKPDGKATEYLHQDGIAIVVIPLRLPAEESESVTKSMVWFEEMDLLNLPQEGQAKQLTLNFSLNIFDDQLGGGYYQLDCQSGPDGGPTDPNLPLWFLLEKPAYITGKVVQAFKDAFPYVSVSDGSAFDSSYFVDGKVKTIGYDELGREHLVGISQPNRDWESTTTTTQIPPGVEWRANANFLTGFGEFMTLGEWYFPPEEAATQPCDAAAYKKGCECTMTQCDMASCFNDPEQKCNLAFECSKTCGNDISEDFPCIDRCVADSQSEVTDATFSCYKTSCGSEQTEAAVAE